MSSLNLVKARTILQVKEDLSGSKDKWNQRYIHPDQALDENTSIWKTRQHGYSKRRRWRELHLGVDKATGEIWAMVVSSNNLDNGAVLPDVFEYIDREIEQVFCDGAYDSVRVL